MYQFTGTLRRIRTAVNTSSVFFIALGGDEKSTFPKGEGFCAKKKNRPLGRF